MLSQSHRSEVVNVGFQAQVIVTTTTAESVTTTVNCPGQCVCGLQVVPQLYHVEGYQSVTQQPIGGGPRNACSRSEKVDPYVVEFPVIDPNAAQNNQAVVQYSACIPAGMACPSDPNMPVCPAS